VPWQTTYNAPHGKPRCENRAPNSYEKQYQIVFVTKSEQAARRCAGAGSATGVFGPLDLRVREIR
jgi:hypothetical protein